MNQPKPWITVLSSLLAPGLGHLYVGHIVRAVIFGVLNQVLRFLLAIVFVIGSGAVVLGAMVLALAAQIAIAIDAWRLAKRGRVHFFRRASLASAIVVFVVGFAIVGTPLDAIRRRFIGDTYRVPSGGMFPTMLVGDHFFSNRLAYLSGEPKRGDVVVVVVAQRGSATFPADLRPDLPRETFVKRIVGIPGDRVAFKGVRLFVNEVARTSSSSLGEFIDDERRRLRSLAETLDGREYQVLDSEDIDLPDFGPMIVEPGRFFIAGDNRDHSKDSRYFGTVSREFVLAPTGDVYWSWDFNGSTLELINPVELYRIIRDRTRWSRIGMPTN